MLVPYASLQHEHPEYYSGDPAFEAPPEPPPADAAAELKAQWKKARKLYDDRVDTARERNDWSGLRVAGTAEPTKFILRPLPTDALAQLTDMATARTIGRTELAVLAFRIALVRVENLGKAAVTFEQHARFGKIATTAFLDAAGMPAAITLAIAQELGGAALDRASHISPKP